ncbi:hypothetical protein predicted by Glimmer/Critica [Limosilactobacillus fermentum]|nr:hypothetical protein predicted by Glimmer/Critica [Limosilactobacillus fermentum]
MKEMNVVTGNRTGGGFLRPKKGGLVIVVRR